MHFATTLAKRRFMPSAQRPLTNQRCRTRLNLPLNRIFDFLSFSALQNVCFNGSEWVVATFKTENTITPDE